MLPAGTAIAIAPPPVTGGLPPGARRSLVAGVLAVHLAGAWALLQVDAVREAAAKVAPLMVDLIAAPPPPPPAPPPPPPPSPPPPAPRPKPLPRKPPPPAPLAAAPTPAPEPPVPVAPPPAVEPPPPAPQVVAAPPAPPALPLPPPAPPAQPKTVPATAVQYLAPPAPVYPRASRRHGEAGRVVVRVLIDEGGLPAQVRLQASSGHSRLDEAALAALREARFRPYTENGVAQRVWALVPIHFELES